MAVTLPLFINAVDYNAETERRGFSGLLAQSAAGVARSGVLGPAPSVSLSGSTVQVGPFNAAISSAKGAYLLAVDSVTSAGTVGVADATNPRLDRIVLEVLDPDNGSGGTSRLGRLRVIPGTPAALPGLPPLPALALHVGQVQVPKSGGGNAVVTVDCPFTAAAGAPVPVRSEADRALVPAVTGAQVQRLDRQGAIEYATDGGWYEPGGNLGYKALVQNSQLGGSDQFVELPGFNLDFDTTARRAVAVEFSGVLSALAGSKYVFAVTIDGIPVRRSEVVVSSTRVETAFTLTGRLPALAPGKHKLRILGANRAGGDYLIHAVSDNYGASYVTVRDDGMG